MGDDILNVLFSTDYLAQREIMLNLDLDSIRAICGNSVLEDSERGWLLMENFCNNDGFWREKFNLDFPDPYYIPSFEDWRDLYIANHTIEENAGFLSNITLFNMKVRPVERLSLLQILPDLAGVEFSKRGLRNFLMVYLKNGQKLAVSINERMANRLESVLEKILSHAG
jgi:hypothetical protein